VELGSRQIQTALLVLTLIPSTKEALVHIPNLVTCEYSYRKVSASYRALRWRTTPCRLSYTCKCLPSPRYRSSRQPVALQLAATSIVSAVLTWRQAAAAGCMNMWRRGAWYLRLTFSEQDSVPCQTVPWQAKRRAYR